MNKQTRNNMMIRMSTIKCPKCGCPITYNGNYFCVNWVFPFNGEQNTCNWALEHPQETYEDKFISWVIVGYWEQEDSYGYDQIRTRPVK